jgi:hypothetical protein
MNPHYRLVIKVYKGAVSFMHVTIALFPCLEALQANPTKVGSTSSTRHMIATFGFFHQSSALWAFLIMKLRHDLGKCCVVLRLIAAPPRMVNMASRATRFDASRTGEDSRS